MHTVSLDLIASERKPSPSDHQRTPSPYSVVISTDNVGPFPPGFQRAALDRFRSFCSRHKDLLQLCVEFSLKETAMQRIYKISYGMNGTLGGHRSMHYLAWKTATRNSVRYSQLETEHFECCSNHLLFGHSDATSWATLCEVYIAEKLPPESTIFEYITLLPRVTKWVADVLSCERLFEYRHKQRTTPVQSGGLYTDVFDGSVYEDGEIQLGVAEALKWDVFLSISTDGFQTFENGRYDCWPISTLLLNLHPRKLFLIRNVVPLGFIKGPQEPKRLDTFLIPIIDELNSSKKKAGTELVFHDGQKRRVLVHVLLFSGHLPAVAKMSGTTGASGIFPCRFCDLERTLLPSSNRYYYPSKIRQHRNGRMRIVPRYQLHEPGKRSLAVIKRVLGLLDVEPRISKAERRRISRAHGIKWKTELLGLPTLIPYKSFSIDMMHETMNITRDLMEIWKGENLHLSRLHGEQHEYVMSQEGGKLVDEELLVLGQGTCYSLFGARPRSTATYASWKGSECTQFILHYFLIVLDGFLPVRYLKGAQHFYWLFNLCGRPALSQRDVSDMKRHAVAFVHHMEQDYYHYSPRRLGICKYPLHQQLHLALNVDALGPPLKYSQQWKERYVGWVKHRLNARNLAAEPLSENAKLLESYKLFFKEGFAEGHSTSSENDSDVEETELVGEAFSLLHYVGAWSVNGPTLRRLNLKSLLANYVTRAEKVATGAASSCIIGDMIEMYCHALVPCDDRLHEVGAWETERDGAKRSDFFC
ncbi:hypothetical protein BWQ96_08613 [Gracilariopsis chorda]|uniref:Transposase family Tnp2 protein n=1 Tax=Gracilariopsis chorda TaxID=448386 RepID=A0A2V3IHW7_9FLOR|nr:hypothetical protein BWQ96_08613 [Gracilariopsis chorda]|eukprot:PXF41662.1 hypothetical protein BWQ96_08613 [Gracilariopsis chorda]